jgi:hypothetical protein
MISHSPPPPPPPPPPSKPFLCLYMCSILIFIRRRIWRYSPTFSIVSGVILRRIWRYSPTFSIVSGVILPRSPTYLALFADISTTTTTTTSEVCYMLNISGPAKIMESPRESEFDEIDYRRRKRKSKRKDKRRSKIRRN